MNLIGFHTIVLTLLNMSLADPIQTNSLMESILMFKKLMNPS